MDALDLAAAHGTRVESLEHPGTFGVVRPATWASNLLVVWTENPWYNDRLSDYIASTEWDLLEMACRADDPAHPTIPVVVA